MEIIYEGKLKKGGQLFSVRSLTLENLQQILRLQESVIESLEQKAVLQPLTLEEFQYILEGNGLMIGAFVKGELIAFRALLVPPIDQEGHLGRDFGLTEEELQQVIYQEISNVHPDYRGNGLQKKLAVLIMKELREMNKAYIYVCCTVAPFNIPSLKDKFEQGMEIVSLKEKYDGLLRYTFMKKIDEDKQRGTGITTIKMSDTAGQQALLKEGWSGFQMENRDGVYVVHYWKK
ncbi:GNAT superfamily N-acetyltransferase [Bacillus fengqiuensis]|nr:GNAT superfamily N-acetyltransferase [Bacillus fengqiuensis]